MQSGSFELTGNAATDFSDKMPFIKHEECKSADTKKLLNWFKHLMKM